MQIKSVTLENPVQTILAQLGADGGSQGIELVTVRREAPGVSVKRQGDRLEIAYSEKVLLFRGLGLAAERGEETDYQVEQCSAFTANGLMLDCSRNAVASKETVKDLIHKLALMGCNTLMLYTEDTYELDGEPYFGHMRGRYSRQELKELDAYAAGFGVEMIPCIQTLAHLPCAFKWQKYDEIRDIDDILLADDDRTYALIDKMIAACREVFRSKRIHIGMDEAGHLGRGRYRDLHGEVPSIDIMCRHLEKVLEICRKYEFRPMMWNDMFFALAGAGYCPQNGIDASLLEKVPADVSMVYWDYYATEQSVYDDNFSKQVGLPNELIFAGGAWKWSGFASANFFSMEVSRLALDSAIRHGVKRVFTTLWGDNGNDASTYSVLPSVLLFAEYGFNPAITQEELASRFRVCMGGELSDFLLLDQPDYCEGDPQWAGRDPSKYLFYQDPLTGLFDRHADEAFDAFYRETAEKLAQAAQREGRYAHVFRNLSALCAVLELKASVGIRLKKAYDAGDRTELARLAGEVLPEIARRTDRFKDCMEAQWMAENKPFGFEVQDIRIAGVAARARSAAKRVEAYLNGEVPALEELEQDRLYIDHREEDGDRKSTCCNCWDRIVTSGLM